MRKFTRGVVDQMSDLDWREVRYWADHIAIWIPGFPSGDALLGPGTDDTAPNKDLLADAVAHFIWNATVRHSADHQTLHEMMDGRRDADGKVVVPARPVPFIMRVKPPMSKDYELAPANMDTSGMHFLEKAEAFLEHLTRSTPLCWPTDLLHAHWADLLFYMPHNSRRLMDLTATMEGGSQPELCVRHAGAHRPRRAVPAGPASARPEARQRPGNALCAARRHREQHPVLTCAGWRRASLSPPAHWLGDCPGQRLGVAIGQASFARLDHHAQHGFGPGGPQQHATRIAQRRDRGAPAVRTGAACLPVPAPASRAR